MNSMQGCVHGDIDIPVCFCVNEILAPKAHTDVEDNTLVAVPQVHFEI